MNNHLMEQGEGSSNNQSTQNTSNQQSQQNQSSSQSQQGNHRSSSSSQQPGSNTFNFNSNQRGNYSYQFGGGNNNGSSNSNIHSSSQSGSQSNGSNSNFGNPNFQFNPNNLDNIGSFLNNIFQQNGLGGLINGMNISNNTNSQQGGQGFTHVYSNVNGNSNNFNFNEEIINNNNSMNQREVERQIKEFKNIKYRQLYRAKYSEYIEKKRKVNPKRTECDTCSICLEKYKMSDMVLEFNCKEHFFHKDCLKEWIKKSEYCPLCKFDLLYEYRDVNDEDEEEPMEDEYYEEHFVEEDEENDN